MKKLFLAFALLLASLFVSPVANAWIGVYGPNEYTENNGVPGYYDAYRTYPYTVAVAHLNTGANFVIARISLRGGFWILTPPTNYMTDELVWEIYYAYSWAVNNYQPVVWGICNHSQEYTCLSYHGW
jgi:hypothetical protein